MAMIIVSPVGMIDCSIFMTHKQILITFENLYTNLQFWSNPYILQLQTIIDVVIPTR